MNKRLSTKRYTPEMLAVLGAQSFPSLVFNAVGRGVLFTIVLQLLAFASTGHTSGLLQIVVLAFIFSLFIFSVDLIEKYWAQNRLNKLR